jgi:predicted extracellular nuclease
MLPDIVALLEVENDSTLFMLTRRSLLKGAGYRYVMTNSLDARGIDVAMIYNPLTFRLESSYSIRPELKRSRSDTVGIRTRDILYAKGVMRARDTLHIFIVHAPSRRNGKSATEGYRLQVEQRMMQSVDSIRNINPDAKIVLMGDFNDYSNDRALKDIVSRGFVETSKGIRGLNYEKTGVSGTYKYQGAWNSLDHIFLSTGVQQQVERCFIYDAAWLLEEDNQGGYKPFRTYLGPKYHDGVSDHLPIVLQLKL